jgi:hypothetical protein
MNLLSTMKKRKNVERLRRVRLEDIYAGVLEAIYQELRVLQHKMQEKPDAVVLHPKTLDSLIMSKEFNYIGVIDVVSKQHAQLMGMPVILSPLQSETSVGFVFSQEIRPRLRRR